MFRRGHLESRPEKQQEKKPNLETYLRNLGFKSERSIGYLSSFDERKIQNKIEKLERLGLNPVELLDQQPTLIHRIGEIERICEELRNLNFNVLSLAGSYPQIFFRRNLNNLKEVLSCLQEAGFKDPQFLITLFPKQIIEDLGAKNIRTQVAKLKRRGFTKSAKVMEFFFKSGIFNLNFEYIDRTIQDMKKLKFPKPILTIERYPKIIYVSLEEKIKSLVEMGFKDPIRMIQRYPSLVHLRIENRLEQLKSLGFKNPINLIEREPRLLGIDISKSVEKLKAYGFEEPVKLIDRIPFFAYRNLDKIIAVFKKIGVVDPIEIIKKNPRIIAYANRLEEAINVLKKNGITNPIDVIVRDQSQRLLKHYKEIDTFIERLKRLGFSQPIKLIARYPRILGSKIEERVKELKSLGFKDPVKIIEKFPPIAVLNIERIIGGIKSLGFANPVDILERNPALFGFSSETLKKRLEILRKLDKRYNLNLFESDGSLSEINSMFLNTSNLKIIFSLRLALYLNDLEHLREFITHNPFICYYILKLSENEQIEDKAKFFRSLMNKYKRNLSKSELKNIINEVKNALDKDIIDFEKKLRQEPTNQKIKKLLKMALLLKKISLTKSSG